MSKILEDQLSDFSKNESFENFSSSCVDMSLPRIILDQKLTCIVANDNSFSMMASVYILEQVGIEVRKTFINGLDAVQYVKEYPDLELDFVLLDLDMPIMNGFDSCSELLKMYKQKNTGNKPLIFAFSGFVNDQIRNKAMKTGFSDILLTPLSIESVLNVIIEKL